MNILRRRLIAANLVGLVVIAAALTSPSRPLTARAIDDVRHRVEYVQTVLPHAQREYLVALAVNSYVIGHVSAPAYGYLREIEHRPPPEGSDRATLAEAALESAAGLCGDAVAVAMTLYAALGVEARQVSIWYDGEGGTPDGHTTTEVRYDGRWHWFDPTWGLFYEGDSNIHSLVEVLEMSEHERDAAYVGNDAKLWMRVVRAAGKADWGPEFTSLPHLTVEVEGFVIYQR